MSEFSELQQPMLFGLLSINETNLIRQYLEGICKSENKNTTRLA